MAAVVFPDRFTWREMEDAYSTLRNWRPDEYERFYSVLLLPGESIMRDNERRLAERERL